ncbi:MAG TPA: RNA polymerase sigma factor [Candidatus Acidoferrales bacterium]|jgi:RNA polymerase sigma-70 factor (ECF subfamily)|nr:RNA polymerase sigma factor [Candidatus Acidoferrales bacterium]
MNGLNVARVLSVAPVSDAAERLATLFDAHSNRLNRLARRLTRSREDALDLVQETFVKAAKHLTSIPDGAANEEAWLVRVLINTRRDQWRKASIRTRQCATPEAAPHRDSFEASLIARDTVWQALDVLSPRRRAILVMHELEGLSTPATASLLGISEITTRWHLSKGKRELARILKPSSGDKK